jgi:hypothetical protein
MCSSKLATSKIHAAVMKKRENIISVKIPKNGLFPHRTTLNLKKNRNFV